MRENLISYSKNSVICKWTRFTMVLIALIIVLPKCFAQSQTYTLSYGAVQGSAVNPYYAYVTAAALKIRKGPGMNSDQIGILVHSERVQVIAHSGSWRKIKRGYSAAYVSGNYLSLTPASSRSSPHFGGPASVTGNPIQYGPLVNTSNDLNVSDYNATVTAGALNVRKGPGTQHGIHKSIPFNYTVRVTHHKGIWLRIQWGSGLAYVHGNYVKRKTVIDGIADPEGLLQASSNAPVTKPASTSAWNATSSTILNPASSILAPSVLCNWQSPTSYTDNYFVKAFKKTQMRGQAHENCPAGSRYLEAGSTGRVIAEKGDWVYLQNIATSYYGWAPKISLIISVGGNQLTTGTTPGTVSAATDNQAATTTTPRTGIAFIPSLASPALANNLPGFFPPIQGGTYISSNTPNCLKMEDRHRHSTYCKLQSIGIDFTPVGGDIKGVVEAITGKDYLTDEELALWERGTGLILCTECKRIGQLGGFFVRHVDNLIRRSPGPIDDVADLVDDAPTRPAGSTPATTIPGLDRGPNGNKNSDNTFSNLKPGDPIRPQGFSDIPVTSLFSEKGKFNYVVTHDGSLIVADQRYGHIDLANGDDVLAAGTVTIEGGQVLRLDNDSGHYKPFGDSTEYYSTEAFEEQANLNISSGTYVSISD